MGVLAFERVTPFDDSRERFAAGRMGMWLFLASLAMLFAASVIAFIVLRITSGDRWPEQLPALPATLWVSTAVLLVSSVTHQLALVAVRRGRLGGLRLAMRATLILGLVFLLLQTLSWLWWLAALEAGVAAGEPLRFALSAFYVLTGVHALHVVGGLVPITLVTSRAGRGRYHAADHAGVQYCAMYWHFLDAVWLVLLATLVIGL